MPIATKEKIKNLAEKIAKEYKPEKIILYGSYAWGNPDEWSDIDLFVVKETEKNIFERNREAQRIIFGSEFPVDILVYTPQQLAKREKMGDPFINSIIINGKIIYEQPAK